ncbi:TNFAIP3-interacting protein 1-like [Morone saxatilis]|uniref:TNFAIP3-interacting protein 1-like n=1 Tax=Morone saxatilis TaxID=34816 RepID=UPI0015E224AA|nr:TNFAIP3-interacting protein 1-like [Morone saxatilis]
MSLHKNTLDRPPVERSQAGETATTDIKKTHRLYPSLPNMDRYEIHSVGEKLHTGAGHHPHSLLGDTQPEALAACSDVRMKAQILILEEQRQELLSINEKWSKEYRTMKQYYREKVEDLKALLQHDYSHFEEETCEEGEKNITLYKKDKERTWTGDRDVSSELLKAQKEAKELRAQNSTLVRKGQHQHEEIRRLNKTLEEALQPLEVSKETLQDLWKHQAEVYKEDFLKERKDREKLKEKYLELEKKFRKVYSELRVLKPQVDRTQAPKPALECTCTNRAKSPDWEVRPLNQHHVQSQRRYTLDNQL